MHMGTWWMVLNFNWKLERIISNIVDTGTYDYAQSLTEYWKP